MLRELAQAHPSFVNELVSIRPLLRFAANDILSDIEKALHEEEYAERIADRTYWEPLKAELMALRQMALQAEEDV